MKRKIISAALLILVIAASLIPAAHGTTVISDGHTFSQGGILYQVYEGQAVPAEFLQADVTYSDYVQGLEVAVPWDAYSMGYMRNMEIVKTVTFADGTKVIPFNSCSGMPNLESVTIPPSVETIKPYAFERCEKLTTVNFSEGLVHLDYGVFYGCSSLAKVKLPSTLRGMESGVFSETAIEHLILPEGMESIEYYAFSNMASLRSVTIPSTIFSIGDGAFNRSYTEDKLPDLDIILSPNNRNYNISGGCLYTSEMSLLLWVPPSMEGVFTIPASVRAIQDNAFNGCDRITELVLPEGAEACPYSIGYMKGLKRISLPSTVTYDSIGTYMSDVASLEWIEVSEKNPSIKSIDGVLYSKDGSKLLQFPSGRTGNFRVPDSVLSISYYAFNNSKLTELIISKNVKAAEAYLFGYQSTIKSITVGNRLTENLESILHSMPELVEIIVIDANPSYISIDGVLFKRDGSTLLLFPEGRTGSYTVPAGVSIIGENAFSSSKLDEIVLPEGVVELEDYAFSGAAGTVRIPASLATVSEFSLTGTYNGLNFVIDPANPVLRVDGKFVLYENELYQAIGTFGDVVIFPRGITRIPSYMMGGVGEDEVRSVVVPEGVAVIERYAFGSMSRLEHVSLPLSLREIGEYAFSSCVSLEKVILPPKLEKIGSGAFYGCQRLGSITIPDSVTDIASNAFEVAGFGLMDGWDQYNPTPTNFVMAGANCEIIRWAAYMNQCLWLDMNDPNAEPVRIESLLPVDVMYAAVLTVDTANTGVDVFNERECRTKKKNVPNGTPVYVVGEDGDVVSFRFIDTEDHGYVKKTAVVNVNDLTGNYLPVYTKLKNMDSKPNSYDIYLEPLNNASAMSVPFVDSEYMRVLEDLGTLLKVVTHDGHVGYMPTNHLYTFYKYAGEGDNPWYGLMVVTNPNITDRLNLRASPDRNSSSLGKYFNGTIVEIIGEQGDWYQVRLPDGQKGWMMREYLYPASSWLGGLLGQYEGNG